jgi:hypothetical protein
MVTRSRILGAVLIAAGAILAIVGVGLFSVPIAIVLAGLLIVGVGFGLLVEVRP